MVHLYFALVMLSSASDAACVIVEQPHVFARDLALRVPGFASLPPDTTLAASPVFGARRDLTENTLRQWAATHDLKLDAVDPFCIYRRPARNEDISWEAELREAFDSLFRFQPGPGEISILATQLTPGAPGKLSLERSGLSFDPVRKFYLWRGKLIGEGLHATAKIKFRLTSTERRIVAARPLAAGRALSENDFEEVLYPVRPELPRVEVLTARPSGMVLRRSLPKGTLVLNQHLKTAPLIFPGDSVELVSRSGQAVIRTQGQARNKARLGEPVVLTALETKRLIRAIAVGPGRAEIGTAKERNPQ